MGSSSWRRTMGNVRSFVGNSMGGLRGGTNLASWVVAGTLAYFLWVKPSQDLKREQEERAAMTAASDPYRYVEKRKPIPDPQVWYMETRIELRNQKTSLQEVAQSTTTLVISDGKSPDIKQQNDLVIGLFMEQFQYGIVHSDLMAYNRNTSS